MSLPVGRLATLAHPEAERITAASAGRKPGARRCARPRLAARGCGQAHRRRGLRSGYATDFAAKGPCGMQPSPPLAGVTDARPGTPASAPAAAERPALWGRPPPGPARLAPPDDPRPLA